MKRICTLLLSLSLVLSLCAGYGWAAEGGETLLVLSDTGVTVDGAAASENPESAVYVGAEIIYYHDGTDETYGEGSEDEKHTSEEAGAHTVVTITQPGVYRVSGVLSKGQLAIDLGEDAKSDPSAVVTLILDQVDITCTVAPAVIFYNVYECGSDSAETAQAVVDTSAAGANVLLAPGSVNHVTGSHVARIYKEGTTKKLHKYDGAFYSKMSMNVGGENGVDSGELYITADNEGLDSELHLTINGGSIYIESQDDGINTNEDGVSVTTVNGGTLHISAGLGAEGDGIDSNGYLVINGGTVWTMANEKSPDGGIDADCDILINGGNVYAFGIRNDAASSSSAQVYLELSFASVLAAGTEVRVTDAAGNQTAAFTLERACQSITLSLDGDSKPFALNETYYVYVNGVQQQYTGNSFGMGWPGGGPGMGGNPMEPPEGMDWPPEGFQPGEGRPQPPEGMEMPPEGMTPPEGMEGMEPPGGMMPPGGPGGMNGESSGEASAAFTPTETVRSFSGIRDRTEAEPVFRDIVEGSWYAGAAVSAVSSGLLSITGDQFQPEAAVTADLLGGGLSGLPETGSLTRRELVSALWQASDRPDSGADLSAFADGGEEDSGAVRWAVETGILLGRAGGVLDLDAPLTRAEAAVLLTRWTE